MNTCMLILPRSIHLHMAACTHAWPHAHTHGHMHTCMIACTHAWSHAPHGMQVEQATERLKGVMAGSLSHVTDLFGTLDADQSGTVDRLEFCRAVGGLDLEPKLKRNQRLFDAVCDRLFDEFDIDGSGQIAYPEYVQYTLRSALARSYSTVQHIFAKWDVDGSGTIDKRELHSAIKACGFEAPRGMPPQPACAPMPVRTRACLLVHTT